MNQKLIAVLLCLSSAQFSAATESDKIKIDPNTRLYVSRDDGRVRVFHGLGFEARGTPPYDLLAYNDEQIELMKSVGTVKLS